MLVFREATEVDLVAIVALLADDPLGARREHFADPLPREYRDAYAEIAASPSQRLMVATQDGVVVGTFQLSFLPGLALRGLKRGQIEAVRIARERRGQGLGAVMIRHAVDLCRAEGCGVVQLTTNKSRADAHRFYERLGFSQSHYGYKLNLFQD